MNILSSHASSKFIYLKECCICITCICITCITCITCICIICITCITYICIICDFNVIILHCTHKCDLKKWDVVLICYVLSIVREAFKRGYHFKIFSTESRSISEIISNDSRLISKYFVVILLSHFLFEATWKCYDGPLTRYVKLRVAHVPRMPGTFCPATAG